MTGTGTVNLPAKQLNFRVDPQLVASLEGQGGQKDLAGLGVPVMIVGPWAKPKIYPDIKGILENPVAAYERFKEFGDGVAKLPGLGEDRQDRRAAKRDQGRQGRQGRADRGDRRPARRDQQPQAGSRHPPRRRRLSPTRRPRRKRSKKSKTAKKKSKKDQQKDAAEDAAKQLFDSFLGN